MTTASVSWLLGSTTQIFLQGLTFYFPISSEIWPGNDLSCSSFPGLFILQKDCYLMLSHFTLKSQRTTEEEVKITVKHLWVSVPVIV